MISSLSRLKSASVVRQGSSSQLMPAGMARLSSSQPRFLLALGTCSRPRKPSSFMNFFMLVALATRNSAGGGRRVERLSRVEKKCSQAPHSREANSRHSPILETA